MKRILTLTCLLFTLNAAAQITFGTKTLIDRDWSFSLDGSAARTVSLPHDWSIECEPSGSYASGTGYLPGGKGHYEKQLFIPKTESGRKQYLYFDGVYCCSTVKVNGKLCGYRPNGFLAFCYDITPFVKFGETNLVTVDVDHSKFADSRYYTGSGIYRDVWLVSCDQIHIDNWGVYVTTPEVSPAAATMHISTTVVNDSRKAATVEVRQRLYRKGSYDLVAQCSENLKLSKAAKESIEQNLSVEKPKLWSPERPDLYELETVILKDGKRIDGCKTTAGIRSIRYDADKGFFLNGRSTKIKGVCLHHDAGSMGAIVPRSILHDRLLTLKTLGVNAVRMSHNPQAEMMYDLCDELGFMVMDEAFDEWMSSKRKWVEGWNKGKNPSLDGYAEFFEEWAERDVADMVLRSRNHPSIIMWSIGNEIDYPNDPFTHPVLDYEGINQRTIPGWKPERQNAEILGPAAVKLVAAVHAVDTTRPVTAALAGAVMSNYTLYPGALDIVGYNYSEFRYVKDHAKYPGRVFYGSENRHDYPAWQAVKDNDFVCGQFLWTGFDYLGEAKVWPSRGSHPGLLDYCGEIKPRALYRRTLWCDEPSICAGSRIVRNPASNESCQDWPADWNYKEGDTVCVAVMTNCEEIRLCLNGQDLGESCGYILNANARYWQVPYSPGTLEFSGWNQGKKVAEGSMTTYGEAVGFTAKADRHHFRYEGDVIRTVITVLDAEGRRVKDSSAELKCSVSGNGSLLALENGDMMYNCSYHSDRIPVFEGKAVAYVKAESDEGEVFLNVECMGSSVPISMKIEDSTAPQALDTTAVYSEVYRHDPDLRIFFLYPDRKLGKKELLPTNVFFFGGGWTGGSVQAFAGQARELAALGMAVALVDYRVASRHHTSPDAALQDAKSAVRYIRKNAARLHIDPNRICTSGGSAGGHLAAAVAFCPGFDTPGDDLSISTVPNAMVLYNPVFNNAPEPEGYGYNRIKDCFPAFSPYHNIKAPVPPTLVMLGSKDHLIPMSTAIAFEQKMKEEGGECETIFMLGQGHGFFNWNHYPKELAKDPDATCYYRVTLDKHIEFLRGLGWL